MQGEEKIEEDLETANERDGGEGGGGEDSSGEVRLDEADGVKKAGGGEEEGEGAKDDEVGTETAFREGCEFGVEGIGGEGMRERMGGEEFSGVQGEVRS